MHIALDDYGRGYSSMSYLHQLPIDILKLDRSFVPDLAGDDRLRSIVGSLHQVARTLGLLVVAEGIEREEDVQILRSMGCTLGQGYHLGRPMGEAAAYELVARGPSIERRPLQLAA
ncbi:MAG: EAL domain-containing protein [Chloroflexi bacterium]|nr:EAL domain-containing protein [Chloroflexota bacterium]